MPSTYSVISNDMPKAGPTVTHPVTTKRRSLYHSNSSESLAPAIKRVSCCTAGVSTTTNTNLKMRSHTPTMDAVDFDNLPPAVRRKYFSSLERLRYAQQHQHQNGVSLPSSNHGRTMSSTSGKFTRLRSRSRPSYDSFRSTQSPSRPAKLCKSNSEANAFLLSQADAKWYLELPETIRRKHFSREERILLATKCESIIVDAADEAIYRMGRCANRSLDTLDSHRASVSGFRDPIYDKGAMNAVEEIRKSFQWLDEDGALDLRLGEYYCPGSNKFEKNAVLSRSSHKRTLSLSGRTFRTHSSSSSVPTIGRPSLGVRRPTSRGINAARHQPSFSQSISSMDTDAAYYQDPEARLKLRVYLASPQKFDEAVEFGFPSTTEPKGFSKTRPGTATIRKVEPGFDELPSKGDSALFDDLDNVSMTVGGVADCRNIRELEEQDPLGVVPSRISNVSIFDPYLHASPGNREMTLRMTLTRKDLRADEKELYGWRKNDPLALEDLPPASDSDAGNFDWGHSGKSSQTGLRKLWRKMRGLRY